MVTGFHHCWSSGVARRVANRAVPWRHRVSARFGAITSAATFGHRIDPSDSGRVYWQRNVGGRHTLLPRRALPFQAWRVGDWYRASTLLEPFITSVASPILRACMSSQCVGCRRPGPGFSVDAKCKWRLSAAGRRAPRAIADDGS
jgi:hypothetical protein